MKKNLIAVGMILMLILTMVHVPVRAASTGDERMVLGEDLTEQQIMEIYAYYGIVQGTVQEIYVGNDEERAYLAGLVPDEKIGKKSYSCVYINLMEEGYGLQVTTNNINWCTEEIYRNALMTAGVENARVMVTAPFEVSGTAALTGIYKAYEAMTGVNLDQEAKEVAASELVLTSTLAETIGSEEATMMMNELKKVLDETQDMSDEALGDLIIELAAGQNVTLTEENIQQIILLVRTLEKLDVSQWKEKITQLAETMDKVSKAGDGVSSFIESLGDLFSNVGDFFSNIVDGLLGLFGKK